MPTFSGFPAGKTHLTPIPPAFFSELLPQIDHLVELKVTLYTFWFLNQQQGDNRYITREDFLHDGKFMSGLESPDVLDDGLKRAVVRGTLLEADLGGVPDRKILFFLNSPRGRAALKALQIGDWKPDSALHSVPTLELERPTIFKLYEENIGPLTPMIAETLMDAEQTYPEEWIREALQIAVENNVRKWRYVDAILKSWQEEGRHATDRQDNQKSSSYYLKGNWAKYIEH